MPRKSHKRRRNRPRRSPQWVTTGTRVDPVDDMEEQRAEIEALLTGKKMPPVPVIIQKESKQWAAPYKLEH